MGLDNARISVILLASHKIVTKNGKLSARGGRKAKGLEAKVAQLPKTMIMRLNLSAKPIRLASAGYLWDLRGEITGIEVGFFRFAGAAICGLLVAAAVMCPKAGVCGEPRPVGMEASGISAWVAWHYADRLDVRDSINRPVSGKLIERQVKSGIRRVVDEVAGISQHPLARSMLQILDRISDTGLSICCIPFRLPWGAIEALPWILRSQTRAALALVFISTILGLSSLLSAIRSPTYCCASRFHTLPLRC